MSEYKCVRKIWSDMWRPHRCDKPAKFWVVASDGARWPVCGTHANKAKREGKTVEPVTAVRENDAHG